MMVNNIKSGKLTAIIGSSRSGKTQFALDQLKPFKFVLIWDVEEQYKCTYRVRNRIDLFNLICVRIGKKCPKKAERIAYTGSLNDFNTFCQFAFWWVRKMGGYGEQTAIVFEETADVTSPAKAPEHYGILLRRSLKYGVHLFCITQRPAESDKTSIGNASIVHVCRLSLPRDRKFAADATGIDREIINDLRADQDKGHFDYVTADMGRGHYSLGYLNFKNQKPIFKSLSPTPI